ncbi:MAG: hypothetical protein ISS02_01165 [Candidatus Portnoybacteria bacterium]|nr:hypothetical protein [Candidatus Portnoybacteria bacterium]
MLKLFKLTLIVTIISVASILYFHSDVYANSDTEITYGSEYVFNTASTSRISTVSLSLSKFITTYQDGGASSNQGTAIIGSISEDIISYSSEYVFNSGNTDYISVTALSDNKFVVAYQDISNSNYGTVVIGNISEDIITYSSEYVFNTAYTDHVSVTALSDNKFIVAYQDNRSGAKQGKAIIGNVSGDVITFSSEYIFNPSTTNYISLKSLSSDKIVIVYKDGGNTNYGTAVIGNISGDIITFSSEYIFNPSTTNYISPISLSENKFIITYQDGGGNLNYGRAIIGSIDNNIITYSPEYVFNTGATSYISSDKLSEDKFVVSYQGNSGLNYGKAIIGVVSDDVITFNSKYIFNPTSTSNNFVTNLSNNKFVISYQDGGGNLNYGTSIIGSIPAEEVIEIIPEPEPTPIPEPEPEPGITIDLSDGDLIKNSNAEDLTKFDIYIVKIINNKKFKRLILSPHVFESYGHLNWEDVKDVDQSTIDAYTTSNLVKAVGDDIVYKLSPLGDTGTKEIMNQEYDSDSVYEINNIDRDAYKE